MHLYTGYATCVKQISKSDTLTVSGTNIHVQWNPYIADTIGKLHVGRYRGPAVAEGFYKYYMNEIRT